MKQMEKRIDIICPCNETNRKTYRYTCIVSVRVMKQMEKRIDIICPCDETNGKTYRYYLPV